MRRDVNFLCPLLTAVHSPLKRLASLDGQITPVKEQKDYTHRISNTRVVAFYLVLKQFSTTLLRKKEDFLLPFPFLCTHHFSFLSYCVFRFKENFHIHLKLQLSILNLIKIPRYSVLWNLSEKL